jgi:hypothetical protein
MSRKVKYKSILEKTIEDFVKVVEKYAKYVVVSGFVAIAHGRSRGTEDIDIIIERIDLPTFIKLHKSLEKSNFECIQSNNPLEIYNDYLKENVSVRYIKKGTFVPQVELKLAKDALDNYQIETRRKLPLTGMNIYFSSIEMNIAFKEELLKSKKDLDDAKHLRIIYGNKINEKEIEKIKKMIRRLRLHERK